MQIKWQASENLKSNLYRQEPNSRANSSESNNNSTRRDSHTNLYGSALFCSALGDRRCRLRAELHWDLVLVSRSQLGSAYDLWSAVTVTQYRYPARHSVSSIGAWILGSRSPKMRRFNHSLCGWPLLIGICPPMCTGNHSPCGYALKAIGLEPKLLLLKYSNK
ncbi:uncharacterized protein LOC121466863 [Drosophila elegans]|uniref:uncharacterized protein LOC121466863 n=1 Tax=Drosophila elegans TaxID=30023 RepID=UPI001BC846A2|nr:uncharacterized protein LOC121466863 [Drosophila elegans]